MQGINEDAGGAQISVDWQVGAVERGDASVERAAAYASVLARTLNAVGYQPRHLSVGLRREERGLLQLSVRGEVPGISEADFESLARATLNGVSTRLGFSQEGDLVLVARLVTSPLPTAPAVVRETAPPHPKAPTTQRDWFFIGRVAVGLVLGLALGVLGLPRLELPMPSLPIARSSATAVLPTQIEALETAAQQPIPTPAPPPPTPTAVRAAPTATVIRPLPTPIPTPNSVLFAERFVAPLPNWPNDPLGMAWFVDGEYRLFARDPGRFVATGVPLNQTFRDVRLSAQFHKVSGPAGGGYGFIIRDQGPTADRDSRNQAGQYLVLEVGDRGDIGIWQREGTRWIDIVPWIHSEMVREDRDPNALTVTTRGPNMRFEVNGEIVADVNYDRLPSTGGVGIFVGGDLNEVALEWLRIENP